MERCTKRRRLSYAPILHAIHSSKSKITAKQTKDSTRNHDSDSCIAEKRALLDKRLKATFESIFEKYGKNFEGIGDEIDIATGEIVVNNGHLLRMENESDLGDSLCFRKNEQNLVDEHSEDSSTLGRNNLEHSDYQVLEREKDSDLKCDEVTPDSEEDCIEDDLILRGFSQVNRLSKYTSEEASCHRLSTNRRGSWTPSQTPNTLRAIYSSNDRFFSRIETFEVHPRILEQTPNYDVRREDDIEPAWQITKQPTLQKKYSVESSGKLKSLKQSTTRAGKSLFAEPVESFWSSTQQKKNSKLKKVDSRVYINEISSLEFNKTDRNVRSYVNEVCQNYIYSLRTSKSQNLRKQENSSKSSPKNCSTSCRDSEKYFESEAKRIRLYSKILSKNGSSEKMSAQLQTDLTLNDKPEVIRTPFEHDQININPEEFSETSLEKFKQEKPQHEIPAQKISESYLSPIGSVKAHETCKLLDSDSSIYQTKNKNTKSENNKALVPVYHKIINQSPKVFDSHQNLPPPEQRIEATRKQFHTVSLPRTKLGNNCTKDEKANSGSQTSIPLSLNGLDVNLDLGHKIRKSEDRNIPRVTSHTDNMNHAIEHPNPTPENTSNAKKNDVAHVEPVMPQRLTYSDSNKKSQFKCTDLDSKLISKSSISVSKSNKTQFMLRRSKIQGKKSDIKCAANNYESSTMSKDPSPFYGSNGNITTSCEKKPSIKPRFYPDVSISQPSSQDFYLTPLPVGKEEKQNSILKVTTTYETPKRPEPGPKSRNTSNSNSKSILSINASKLNENHTKLGQCYLPTPTNTSEATAKPCVAFDEHSRLNLNKENVLSPVNQKFRHKLLAETVLTTHQSLSNKSENRANPSSSTFLTETRTRQVKEHKRSPREDRNHQELKADTSNEISSIKKENEYDILYTKRDVDLSVPIKLLNTEKNLNNGVINTPSNHENPKTSSTVKGFSVTHTVIKVLPESKHRNLTCGVIREDINQPSRKFSYRSFMKTTKDLINWSPNSEDVDELSFDLPDKSSTFVLGPCSENKAVSSSSRVLSTIKRKRKRKTSLTNSIEESDVDELCL